MVSRERSFYNQHCRKIFNFVGIYSAYPLHTYNSSTKAKTMIKHLPLLFIMLNIISCQTIRKQTSTPLSGEQISERFIDAVGGRKKLSAVTTAKMHATYYLNMGALKFESYRKAPDKMMLYTYFANEKITTILNGDQAYFITSEGKKEITGQELANLQEEALIFPELYLKELCRKLEYLGIEKLEGKNMHKVKTYYKNGQERTHFYDVETALLKKVIVSDELIYQYGDYKQVDGIFIPHDNQFTQYDETFRVTIDEISYNLELDEKLFELD